MKKLLFIILPLATAACSSDIPTVNLGIDDIYYVSRMQKLPLNPAFIVRVDPATLECETVPVPDGMYPPANSWYAWTPDAFVASAKDNCLYWKGGSDRWFSGSKIYRYDLDSGTFSLWADLDADVYTLSGVYVGRYPAADGGITLPRSLSPGVYIARSGGSAVKIAVR
ncbi:MAG: DUF5074 domain-containing protein [Muribaculaceae bacterium]|nr:DUF5074 domain-containing protein [Muribaculaceae bacterium]